MKASGRGIWLLLVFVLAVALPSDSECRGITLTPALGIAGLYDDNVLFTGIEPEADYASIVNPSLSLDYLAEQTELIVSADVRFFNYLDQTELDTTKQIYLVDHESRLTERFRVTSGLDYILDTLFDSELEETGRVTEREDRERFNARAGMHYGLSTKSDIGLDYKLSWINYEEGTRSDRIEHAVWGNYSRLFNDGLDKITVQPEYAYKVASDDIIDRSTATDTIYEIVGDIEVHSYSLNVGWTRKSSEIGTIKLFGGARYTEETRLAAGTDEEIEKTDTTGFIADLSYAIRNEISSFSIGYRRNIGFDANNDLREIDRLYSKYGYAVTERLKFNIEGSFYASRSESETSNNSSFFNALTSLDFRLTENHSLALTYRYSQESSDVEGEESVKRNQVYLTLILQFPKKF